MEKLKRKTSVVPRDASVLSIAVTRVADFWNLTNETVGQIIGLSAPTISRLRNRRFELERGTKPFELSQYLVRIFRSLDSLVGSDDAAAISWLNMENGDLRGRPIEKIKTVKGLIDVANYVDAFRARI